MDGSVENGVHPRASTFQATLHPGAPMPSETLRLPLYQVDAFARGPFTGNPAAVCPLDAWLPDDLLQSIALENNLSETAYLVPEGQGYHLRWFTPRAEVDLCGHATLASAYVVFRHLRPNLARIEFRSMAGPLAVERSGDLLELDFPARPASPLDPEHQRALRGKLSLPPAELASAGRDLMAVLEDEASVRDFVPDLPAIAALEEEALIITAPGEPRDDGGSIDFVSRYFCPRFGIEEDPATGSAHCTTAPYWSERLGKQELAARQLSYRGADLRCRIAGDRVHIAGAVRPYLEGRIEVDLGSPRGE